MQRCGSLAGRMTVDWIGCAWRAPWLKTIGIQEYEHFEAAGEFSRFSFGKQMLAALLPLSLLFAGVAAEPFRVSRRASGPAANAPTALYATKPPSSCSSWLRRLRCIRIRSWRRFWAASTFPEQVVEADRWVQAHPDLRGSALARPWTNKPWGAPSVKALSALSIPSLEIWIRTFLGPHLWGDAYYNQQQDVMDAVQVMRQRAQAAGNLKTTPAAKPWRRRTPRSSFSPRTPTIVYVPAYDPWLIFGDPILAWPGLVPVSGIWYGGPYLSFRTRLRNRLLWRFRMGFGGIGDSIGVTDIRSITTSGNYSRSNTFLQPKQLLPGGRRARRAI